MKTIRQDQKENKEQGFVITFRSDHVVREKTIILVQIPPEFTQLFQLLDDDGNIYFRGFQDPVHFDEFTPLDWYGVNYGCTELQYKDGTEWKTL